jgi:hypothetical protein
MTYAAAGATTGTCLALARGMFSCINLPICANISTMSRLALLNVQPLALLKDVYSLLHCYQRLAADLYLAQLHTVLH